MAFFGITSLGYQNLIRERTHPDFREGHEVSKLEEQCIERVNRRQSQETVCESYRPKTTPHDYKFPININQDKVDRTKNVIALDQVTNWRNGHHGSALKFKDLRHRHTRNPREPAELYRYPCTTSQEIGFWRRYGPNLGKTTEPWLEQQRFPNKESEMTKFVAEMALTNRDFSLF